MWQVMQYVLGIAYGQHVDARQYKIVYNAWSTLPDSNDDTEQLRYSVDSGDFGPYDESNADYIDLPITKTIHCMLNVVDACILSPKIEKATARINDIADIWCMRNSETLDICFQLEVDGELIVTEIIASIGLDQL